MSVKPERRTRLNSAVRDLVNQYQNLQQNSHHYQPINCVNNKLQIHRKLIEHFTLHIFSLCTKNPKPLQTKENSEQKKEKQQNNQSIQKSKDQQDYNFEIQSCNLYITKSQVKHTFPLQNYLSQNVQYLRFQLPAQDLFVIQNYNFSNTKSTIRLILISDEQMMNNNNSNSTTIKPIDLIEQNARLRALKLSKSTNKCINFSGNNVKKLNLNWNNQEKQSKISESCTLPVSNSNSRLKSELKKNSVPNISQQIQIKGIQHKKSIDRFQRNKSKSFSRSQKNLNFKNIGPIHLLQKSKINNKTRMNTSTNSKYLNSSYIQRNQDSLKNLGPKKFRAERPSQTASKEDLMSQSYYTAKKNIEKEIEIPQKIEQKNNMMQRRTKQNIGNFFEFNTKQKTPKMTYTQFRNNRQTQNNIKKIASNLNQTTNLDTKKFNKNISQAKIAQLSKVLNPKNQK